ncbi:MAG: hypothetical protein ABIQ30_00775 [Devosia sp.]
MSAEVERFVRIQNKGRVPGKPVPEWRIIPNGARVRVWEMSSVDALSDDAVQDAEPKRFIFHIGYMDGISKGAA